MYPTQILTFFFAKSDQKHPVPAWSIVDHPSLSTLVAPWTLKTANSSAQSYVLLSEELIPIDSRFTSQKIVPVLYHAYNLVVLPPPPDNGGTVREENVVPTR